MIDGHVETTRARLTRLERALQAQRAYIQRVPDPDNRHRAETNLMTLLEMRDAIRQASREASDARHGAPEMA